MGKRRQVFQLSSRGTVHRRALSAANESALQCRLCPEPVFAWQDALFLHFHFIAIGIRPCFEAAISHHINGWGIIQCHPV